MATHEILTLRNQKASAIRILSAVREATGWVMSGNYFGKSDWLVMFGWGGVEQQNAFKQHRKSGRPVLVLDYSFFTREKNRFRIAVNDYFPTNRLGHAQGGERFGRLGLELTPNKAAFESSGLH